MGLPLKILITNSGRKWIGEVGHCAMLREALARRGHQVWLGVRKGFELESYARREGIPYASFSFSSRFCPWGDYGDILATRDLIRREKIDLVHVHRGKDHWIAGLGAWLAGVPVVRTRHVVTPVKQHPFNQWLYGRGTGAVISVSGAADRSLGTLRERVGIRRTILSAVNWQKFNPSARSEAWRAAHSGGCAEPIWIGLIGRIQAIKGQKYFMRAARIIAEKYPQARFLVAGRGSLAKTRKSGEYGKRYGFADRLLVEGYLDNLPETMASLDIGVVASVGSEGSSRVTMEYMASGVPVVATRVGGIPEILRANERGEAELGVLVPPRDPEALAAAIMGLIENEVERCRLAQAGLRAVRESHDPEKWAEAIERIYYEVLEERE